jgi:hypothetical protein
MLPKNASWASPLGLFDAFVLKKRLEIRDQPRLNRRHG